jgi:hypothetical protein
LKTACVARNILFHTPHLRGAHGTDGEAVRGLPGEHARARTYLE